MLRSSLAGLTAGLLSVTLLPASPASASDSDPAPNQSAVTAPTEAGPIDTRRAPAGVEAPIEVTRPSARAARSAEFGSIKPDAAHDVTWADTPYDEELEAHYRVLAITGARDGQPHQVAVSAPAGGAWVFVLDAAGELVTYASHTDAASNPALAQWEYRAGDFLLVVSDALPLAAPTASVLLTEFTPGSITSGSRPQPLAGSVSATLDEGDRSLPFHGGHYDGVWSKPAGAVAGQDDVVLYFDGDAEQTDWLSVVVVDANGRVLDEYAVEDGAVWFTLEAGQSFVVTSQLPDVFGDYAFDWEVLPVAPESVTVGSAGLHQADFVPLYRVHWTVRSQHLASFPVEASTFRVEVSRDGQAWEPATVEGAVDAARGTAVIRLWDGEWLVRVVRESDGWELTSDDVRHEATGDVRGWQVTSLRLSTPQVAYYPGQQSGWRDLSDAVTVTETYRDGSTWESDGLAGVEVQFRYAGSTQWLGLGSRTMDGTQYLLPGTGALRVAAGGVVSNEVPVTVVARTNTYRGVIAKPAKSPTVGGAVVLRGSVTEQYADGSWHPVTDGRWYKLQRKSGKTWVTVHSGRVKSTGAGAIDDTISLPGSGTYRVTFEGRTVATWKLTSAAPTRTAKVARPVVLNSSATWHVVEASATQRFSDKRWGPAKHGWKYKVQYRAVGAKKWRTVATHSVHQAGTFSDQFRTPAGAHEIRVVGTFKGRTYTSPVARA